jgi:23S rRNA (cytosine1962-C5)-methyltransferase
VNFDESKGIVGCVLSFDYAFLVFSYEGAMTDNLSQLTALLEAAVTAREALFDDRHETALRLFNGFAEGWPTLVLDVYGRTLVVQDYSEASADQDAATAAVAAAQLFCTTRLPWLEAVLLKRRNAESQTERNGVLLAGAQLTRKIRENGVWYALELTLNRDASFYLDTRNLRAWAKQNLSGKTVCNTFAYTGSLGIAAQAGGATKVMQLDLNRAFLNVAKTSCTLNGFAIDRKDFRSADFWPAISKLIHEEVRFDCLFLDPPFYAATAKGVVDTENNYARLMNKVRPLINDGGYLVAVNNGLFVSGATFMATLEGLCADGYLSVEELIPVPPDCVGLCLAPDAVTVTDPAPFNHATKIAVMRVRRKP